MHKLKTVYLAHAGQNLLRIPIYNKGTAFSYKERQDFSLSGLLPDKVETIEEQLQRCQSQLDSIDDNLQKHIYLRDLQDANETLFYRLVISKFNEILPLIYTPTVGTACEIFSKIYRRPRGLFLTYPKKNELEDQIWSVSNKTIKVIVITDGERILGLGDLGAGGMGIPIGKLSLYTACGGISPAYTLPIFVDVGTNNEKLIADPSYIGWRNQRIRGSEYYEYLDDILDIVNRRWPGVLIQFEDFSQQTAPIILDRFSQKYCCFNDDIQGTAAVTVGSLLSICKQQNMQLKDLKIVFAGAGSAAVGIANLICDQMHKEGLSLQKAYDNIFLVNSQGLLTEHSIKKSDFQKKYIKSNENLTSINDGQTPSLESVIKSIKPTVLIGVSGVSNLFTKEIIESMAKFNRAPIILPLSNPSSKVEALPEDIIKWTEGKAIVATGSPFQPVQYKNKTYHIAQCNNSYVFPGIGLGIISTKPAKVTADMMLSAAHALANFTNSQYTDKILPPLTDSSQLSKKIAAAVIRQAIKENLLLDMDDEQILKIIELNFWKPEYRNYSRTAF